MRFIDLITGLVILIVLGCAGTRLLIDTEIMYLKAVQRIEQINDASIITSIFIESVKNKKTADETMIRISAFQKKNMGIELTEKKDEKARTYCVLTFTISGKICSVFAGGDE